jgi:hypothetical protein
VLGLLIAVALLVAAVPGPAAAATLVEGSHKIAQEVARTAQLPQRVINLWWLPVDYWERVARELKWKEEDVRAAREKLALYSVIGVLDATVTPDKKFSFAEHTEIAEKLEVRIGGGEPLPALRKIDPAVTRQLPGLAYPLRASLGPLAPGLRLLLVANTDADGKPRIHGGSSAVVRARYQAGTEKPLEFFWHTPLTSVAGPRSDPKTAEPLEASWRFNPWTGEKLP